MAYTDELDPATIMLGTEDADLIDDKLRKLALAFFERLESIVVDVNADPLVLKPIVDKQILHWSAGSPQSQVIGWGSASTRTWVGPLAAGSSLSSTSLQGATT